MKCSRFYFIMLICAKALAQHPTPPERIRFEYLTVTDGLPENSIFCMIQDHLGFMWLGTQNGLVRYDGTTMTTFRYDASKPFSMKIRQISALHEDRNGDIWIGGRGEEGLCRFDRATGNFIPYAQSGPEKISTDDRIHQIYQDKVGEIWTVSWRNTTRTFVLDRFDPRTRTWTYFRNNPKNSHSLASTTIYRGTMLGVVESSFAEDEDGKLWVVTNGSAEKTLHWIDPKTNCVTRVRPQKNSSVRATFKHIGMIATAGQNLYISSFEKGLFQLNTRTNQLVHFKHDSQNQGSIRSDTVSKVHPHRDGTVWVATWLGLDQLNPKTGVFRHILSRPSDPTTPSPGMLKFLHEMPNGDMWFRSSQGLDYYHHSLDNFTRYAFDPTLGDGTLHGNNQSFMSFLVDKTGRAWVGTFGSGLNKQSRIAHFPLLTTEANNGNSLRSGNVLVVYEAPTQPGVIWFGTDKGLDRLDKKTGHYTHYGHDSLSRSSLGKGSISALVEDKKGRFWVGTVNEGMYQMDRKTGRFIRFSNSPADPNSLMSNVVLSIFPASDGTAWIGTNNGLDHFDPDRLTFKHFYKADTTYSPELFTRINELTIPHRRLASILHPGVNQNRTETFTLAQPTDLMVVAGGDISTTQKSSYGWIEDANGKVIWEFSPEKSVADGPYPNIRVQAKVIRLAAGEYRLRYISGNTYAYGHWTYAPPLHPELWGIQLLTSTPAESRKLNDLIRQPYFRPGVSDDRIFIVKEDGGGSLWIGSNNGGVTSFDPRTGQCKTYSNPLGGPVCVLTLLEDRQRGGFWVGDYLYGLLFLDYKGKVTRQYAAGSGLPGNSVKSLVRDQEGYLWLTTSNGLVRFDPTKEEFRVFNDTNGVQFLENSQPNGLFRASDGELFVGGSKGVHAFYPRQVQHDAFAPPVVLTDLTINGQTATLGEKGQLPVHISIAKEFTLPYNQNDLTFHFAALSYSRSSESHYAYQLRPIDEKWVPGSTLRLARYSDLSPGTYTFRVKAANAEGVWNEKGVSIKLTITPPWWRTWWAYVVYAVAFGALLRAYIVYRSRALVQENQVLEEKVARRTNEVREQKEEIEAQRDYLEQTLNELKTTQTQLIQKEKLASLGELAAGIAHEIQNPLNFVNNYSEVSTELVEELKEGAWLNLPESEKIYAEEVLGDLTSNLQKIHHHGGRASSIVRGMLEHARTDSGEKRPTDLNALADEYLRMAYHGFRAKDKNFKCELMTDFDPDLAQVLVAPQEIGRVFLNLFNNAFYVVQQRVLVADEGYQPMISVSTKHLANAVQIRVADNGTGVPESVKTKIFQPFFTTKPTGEGTGLGLSLSYDIITRGHGGTVDVESQECNGTLFTITLPV